MKREERRKILYKKMKEEQDKFREWIETQSVQEILKHTYEYTVREDILMCIENLDMNEEQETVLLNSPFPLLETYLEFSRWETEYMDDLGLAIKTCANAMLALKSEKDPDVNFRKQ